MRPALAQPRDERLPLARYGHRRVVRLPPARRGCTGRLGLRWLRGAPNDRFEASPLLWPAVHLAGLRTGCPVLLERGPREAGEERYVGGNPAREDEPRHGGRVRAQTVPGLHRSRRLQAQDESPGRVSDAWPDRRRGGQLAARPLFRAAAVLCLSTRGHGLPVRGLSGRDHRARPLTCLHVDQPCPAGVMRCPGRATPILCRPVSWGHSGYPHLLAPRAAPPGEFATARPAPANARGRPKIGWLTPFAPMGGAERHLCDLIRHTRNRLDWVGACVLNKAHVNDAMLDEIRTLVPVYTEPIPVVLRSELILTWSAGH